MNNIYITTPIYYVNSSPHIGHAYTNMIASASKRWFLLNNKNTMLLTGTDEHGQKIEESAKKSSMNIREFIDHYSLEFRNLAKNLNMPFDDFIRTSENRHKNIVQKIWRKLLKNDYIYFGKYSGWYSINDETFYKQSDLVDGRAPTGHEVFWKEEESYFFRLSNFQEKLLDFFKKNPDFIIPNNRANEILSFIESGLEDLCISRKNFSHGIKVPDDETQTIYVWIDALTNYISALGGLEGEKFQEFWPQNGSKSLAIHIIGKDISRFHAVYWVALLFALDIMPPSKILIHGWWMNDGKKISKSLGNIIDPNKIIEKFGSDYISYFFLSEIGFDSDGNYSEEKFINKINADLVNNFGNLVSRITNMIEKYFDSNISKDNIIINDFDLKIDEFWENFSLYMNNFKYNNATSEIFKFCSKINLLIDQKKPWLILKNDPKNEEMYDVFFVCMKSILYICAALYSFVPNKINDILKLIFKDKFDIKELLIDIKSKNQFFDIKKINVFEKL